MEDNNEASDKEIKTEETEKFPQLKGVEVYPSRRVLFDLQGQIFGVSVDVLKNVSDSLLFHLAFDEKFRNKEVDGTIFINRSPKHFGTIINIISHCSWSVPESPKERDELQSEVDFYSFPEEITKVLTQKLTVVEKSIQQQMKTLQDQIASYQKEVVRLEKELSSKETDLFQRNNLINNGAIKTDGIYVSISDRPFTVRVSSDFTSIQYNFYRRHEKVSSYSSATKGVIKPTIASIFLHNKLKSYIGCEGSPTTRIDINSIGNNMILVCIDLSVPVNTPTSSPATAATADTTMRCFRITCSFNPDN